MLVPALIPVTIPVEPTVAMAVRDDDQEPPDTEALKAAVSAAVKVETPVIVPAAAFTVAEVVAAPGLQPLASVSVRLYTPVAAVVALPIVGLAIVELNDDGPAHE